MQASLLVLPLVIFSHLSLSHYIPTSITSVLCLYSLRCQENDTVMISIPDVIVY